jgi:hypothetical protein
MRLLGAHLDQIRLAQLGGPVDRILKDGMSAGQFRPLDPRSAMWIVLGLLDTVYLLMPRVMETPGPLEDPILADETRRFIVSGLRATETDTRQVGEQSRSGIDNPQGTSGHTSPERSEHA